MMSHTFSPSYGRLLFPRIGGEGAKHPRFRKRNVGRSLQYPSCDGTADILRGSFYEDMGSCERDLQA